ncbi:MAG: 4Fe-4S dicluster domain-containing protein, partial [Candidatus Altarchaeum sp.]|nr:4Fe-4S dicluster domain-containing protein [Candidatus Altarchaeum sp.]
MTEKAKILIKGENKLEPAGKFINPNVTDLRNWDANLLGRFKPKYYAFIQQCQYCAFGPCDLSKNRKGACGMQLNPQMAREALVTAIVGASSYIARACELNDAIIKKHTYFAELILEDKNFITTTFINLLCGYEPKTAGDLNKALRYANEQIVHLISAIHMGQEASDFDFNSKIFHAGMLSLLAMEIYEILRKFSNNNEGNKINKFEIGFGAIDKSKGIVLIIGNYVPNIAQIINSSAGFEIIHFGSGAFDFNESVKIVGNFASELIYEKTGLADVIVIGTGNVRTDVIENAKKSGTPVIAVSDRNMAGLADLSNLSAGEIFKILMSGEISGCYIKDSEKLADVVGMIATANKKRKNLKNFEIENADAGLIKTTDECINCGLCKKACPVNIDPHLIVQSINRIFNNKTENCETKTSENIRETKTSENTLAPFVKSKDKIINLLKQTEWTATNLAKETGCSRQYIYDVLKKLSNEKWNELSKRIVGKNTYYSLIKGLNEYYKITRQVKDCIECKLCNRNCPNNIQISDLIIAIKEGKEIKAKEISILKKCTMCGLCQEKCPKKI